MSVTAIHRYVCMYVDALFPLLSVPLPPPAQTPPPSLSLSLLPLPTIAEKSVHAGRSCFVLFCSVLSVRPSVRPCALYLTYSLTHSLSLSISRVVKRPEPTYTHIYPSPPPRNQPTRSRAVRQKYLTQVETYITIPPRKTAFCALLCSALLPLI